MFEGRSRAQPGHSGGRVLAAWKWEANWEMPFPLRHVVPSSKKVDDYRAVAGKSEGICRLARSTNWERTQRLQAKTAPATMKPEPQMQSSA